LESIWGQRLVTPDISCCIYLSPPKNVLQTFVIPELIVGILQYDILSYGSTMVAWSVDVRECHPHDTSTLEIFWKVKSKILEITFKHTYLSFVWQNLKFCP